MSAELRRHMSIHVHVHTCTLLTLDMCKAAANDLGAVVSKTSLARLSSGQGGRSKHGSSGDPQVILKSDVSPAGKERAMGQIPF